MNLSNNDVGSLFRRLAQTAILLMIFAAPAFGQTATPSLPSPANTATKIRQFDVQTIETLASAIYKQDQEAWKATDLLFAKIDSSEKQQLRGWIVTTSNGIDTVKFVHTTDNGPVAAYAVTFRENSPGSVSDSVDPQLSPEEVAQYNARILALSSIDHRCSSQYNSVALKDPQGDGWLVWALAATTDPNEIVVGGHYRFTISADGKVVRERDQLSMTCMTLHKVAASQGGRSLAAFFVTQIVSNIPIETTVWLSLENQTPIYVSASDRSLWKVEKGLIAPLQQH